MQADPPEQIEPSDPADLEDRVEPEKPPSGQDPEERTKRLIALVIATVAIIGALLAYIRVDASARADEFKRLAKRLTLEASALKLGSQVDLGFNLTAAQAWLEMAKLTAQAERSGPLTLPDWREFQYNERPWPTAVATVAPAGWYRATRDKLAAVAPLLQPPYSGDVRRYYADISLVEATRLAEGSANAATLQDAWGDKGSSYAFYLAILAIGGALLGLSTTMQGRPRLISFSTGVTIAAMVVTLTVSVLLRPVAGMSQSAIDSYTEGLGLAYRGQTADRTVADDLTREAVAAFDMAISEAPGYANALFERANALYSLRDYERAAEDYGSAIAAGRGDTGAYWNLGWIYYLLGRFEESMDAARAALALNPDLVTVRMNLALSLLAAGQPGEARAQYDESLERAAQQVVAARSGGPQLSYSFWKQVDRSALDLEALLARLDGNLQPWMEAPPGPAISTREEVRIEARSLITYLREASVSLEYRGSLPAAGERPDGVSDFKYGVPGGRGPDAIFPSTPFQAGIVIDLSAKSLMPPSPRGSDTYTSTFEALFSEDVFTYDPQFGIQFESVFVMFDYSGLEDGAELVWKVYRDGREDHSLRWRETWHSGSSGHAIKPLDFVFASPGDYRVEMYYAGRLAQIGRFRIEARR
jgi:tetratricopeptide (TPR) repeat protein